MTVITPGNKEFSVGKRFIKYVQFITLNENIENEDRAFIDVIFPRGEHLKRRLKSFNKSPRKVPYRGP